MAAVDQLQAQRLCEKRVTESGKSYGGYLSCWATGPTQPFQAEVVMEPVGNIETHYGSSNGGYDADPLYVALRRPSIAKPRGGRRRSSM